MLSEAEIDALEYVVEEGRIASMDDYGILRSLLVRVRPEWGGGSALANTSEPVAWIAFATDGSDSSAIYSMREQAQAAANNWGWSFAPLYAHLPLTDKELAALEWFEEVRKPLNSFDDGEYVATLRNLLERLK